MFDYNNIIKTAILSSLSACALLACVEVEQPRSTESGYLSAPSLDIDVEVEDLTQTKALDFGIQAPDPSQMRFVVKDKDNKVVYDAEGLWVDPLVLPVGQYTIDAYAGENGFGAPYFMGTVTGSISALASEVPALSVALANALVNVNVSDALAEHFIKGDKLSLNGDAYEAAYGEWFYVPAGADLSLELTGTNSAGKQVKLSHTLKSPSPKAAYRITCGTETTDWPSISLSLSNNDAWASRIYITTPASFSGNISAENQAAVVYEAIPAASSDWTAPATAVPENGVMVIKGLDPGTEYQVRARVGALVSPVVKVTPRIDGLSVTAAHTSTSGELDGTDVTPTFSKSAAVSNAIQSWKLDICKADGTVLRTQTDLGKSDGSAITATDGWPYLPVGGGEQYVLKASAVMEGQVYRFDDVTLAVPEVPNFSLMLSAYTSYDKYAATNGISKDIAGANGCEPSTLYNAGAKWGISNNLMKNINYQKTLVIDVDGNKSRSYTVTGFDANEYYESVSGLSWSSHTHQVSFTFDGKTVTSPKNTHHITGLPYSYNFVGGSLSGYENDGWTCNGSLEVSDKSLIGRATTLVLDRNATWSNQHGFVVSPRFHIPGDISVQPSVARSVYRSSGNKERIGYIGAVSNNTTSSSTITYKAIGGNSTSGSIVGINEWLTAFPMTPSTPFVAVDSDKRSEAGWSYYFLHEVHLRYK